ncbi:MAG: hypothetical protein Q9184_003159 [Pyrenodesmia sp. 2 TL-2023]
MKPSPTSWVDEQKVGPTVEEFQVLQSKTASPASRNLGLSVEEAFTLAEKALKGHVRTKIRCIPYRGNRIRFQMRQKLPFQVFNKLDAEFFRSVLQRNVSLGWSVLPVGIMSRTCRAGHRDNPRIRIELSPHLLHEGHQEDILAALVHQMVHAYYLQCCGYRDRGSTGAGHDLEHEQPFQALLECVGEHCEPLRKLSPLNLWTPPGPVSRHTTSQDSHCGASCCYGRNRRFNHVDLRDWRDVAKAKAKSLEEAQKSKDSPLQNVYSVDKDGKESPPKSMKDWHLPPEACVFLEWEKRIYPVPRTSVPDRPALTSSPCFKEGNLQLPPGTKEPEFLSLYHFVAHGVYPPSLNILNSATATHHQVSQGPPKIKPHDANVPTYLIELITAFHLGKSLHYKSLCDFALAGLYCLPSTAEDPVAVLEKIYRVPKDCYHINLPPSPWSPDSRLRGWTRTWLAVKQSHLDVNQRVAWYRNNLDVVRACPTWNVRYSQLYASSPELKEDDSIAEDILQASAQPQQPSTPPLYRQPMPMQHPLHLPRQCVYPDGMVPPQYKEHLAAYTSDGRKFPDLSSLSQCLPEDRLLYPRVGPELAPTPLLDAQNLDSYENLRRLQEEVIRATLVSQRARSVRDVYDERALPNIEQQRRPY